jgi:GDP-L-fucose synthase
LRPSGPRTSFLAAARVGGIHANRTFPAEFIHENLAIQNNVLHQSHLHDVRRLLFLGSSCIYPARAPQPMREEHLMTGPLEPTNQAYAVAKIAGIYTCWAYNRQYGREFLPVMPTNLYGPHDHFDILNAHVLPALIRKLHLTILANRGDRDAVARDEVRFGPLPDGLRRELGLDRPQGRSSKPACQITLWGSGATAARISIFRRSG